MKDKWIVMLKLDAIDPKGVELAYLEVRAQSATEARVIAEMFKHPNALIVGVCMPGLEVAEPRRATSVVED